MTFANSIKGVDFSSFLAKFDSRLIFGLASVGTFTLLRHMFTALSGFTKYCLLPRRNLKTRYSGGWAVITGASDGIGKAFAFALAKEGFDIVLIGRNSEKLEAVAKEIRDVHKVQTQVLVFDFASLATEAAVTQLQGLLAEIKGEISIVINNVGVCIYQAFEKQSIQDLLNQINVNINAQCFVSLSLIPRLLARDSQKRSAIINISSKYAYLNDRMLSIYAATKAFNLRLGQNFSEAYSDRVDILNTTLSTTNTAMNPVKYVFQIEPDDFVAASLDQLGWIT
jgi:17beta-estradiol 17-dehydrogenase / very-long-chain 3-oxoacyl-CoA reductase